MTVTTLNVDDFFFVRSDKLQELRIIVRGWGDLQKTSGSLAQFRLIVDTNVIIGDLLWLVMERTNDEAKTQLMETIEAETIDVYAPPALFAEVEKLIPLLAAKKKIDINALYFHWEIYKTKIKREIPDEKLVAALSNSKDPDDAEFVALAQSIGAKGVLTKDSDIAEMGGNSISIECVTYLRNYSRSTAIELNIKVNGRTFFVFGAMAVTSIVAGMKELVQKINNAPSWLKIGLVIALLFVSLHPGARERVVEVLTKIFSGISEATPIVINAIAEATLMAESHKKAAQLSLASAIKEIEKNNPV